jgi:hypothetical protein
MNVTINNKVTGWCVTHPHSTEALETKCTEVTNDDFSTWRNVGKSIYDFPVPGAGNYKIVAVKGAAFDVKAVYSHPAKGGKKKEVGETVTGY